MTDLSNWDVIVVDDEPDNIGVLELVLGFHGASIRIANSGRDCLELMKQAVPTMLLVDIQMPGMSGYELLRHIRNNPLWTMIPIIAVTAHAMVGDDERILSAGFDGYIPKPVDAMRLADQLKQMIEAKL